MRNSIWIIPLYFGLAVFPGCLWSHFARVVVFIAPTSDYLAVGILILLLPYILLALLIIAIVRNAPQRRNLPLYRFIIVLSLVALLFSGWMWKRFIDSTNQHFYPSSETEYTETNYMGNVSPAMTQFMGAWFGACAGGFAVLSIGYALIVWRKLYSRQE
jgi:hypothetical protein